MCRKISRSWVIESQKTHPAQNPEKDIPILALPKEKLRPEIGDTREEKGKNVGAQGLSIDLFQEKTRKPENKKALDENLNLGDEEGIPDR